MRKTVAAAGLALALPLAWAAEAVAYDTMQMALNLGAVLAAEKPCGFAYDQAAIEAFIDKNVPADDMGFPAMLTTMTSGAEFELQSMSESQKTAHCRQVGRIAKSYGFID